MSVLIKCTENEAIMVTLLYDEEDLRDLEPMPSNPLEFIGLALHSIQQWQAEKLMIGKYEVRAILMDQTCGTVDEDDIFRLVGHPVRQFQRLRNILIGNLEP